MCGLTVRVLQQLIGAKMPWKVTVNPTPSRLGITIPDDDTGTILSIPENCDSMEYTKPEAILILSHTKKRSPIQGRMMLICTRYHVTHLY